MRNFRRLRTAGAVMVLIALVVVLAGLVVLARGDDRLAIAIIASGLLIVVLAVILQATPRD